VAFQRERAWKSVFLNLAPAPPNSLLDFLRKNVKALLAPKAVLWIPRATFSPNAFRATIARHEILDRERRESRDGQMNAVAGAFFSR